MREREGGALRMREGVRRGEPASVEVTELLERAVGAVSSLPVAEPSSELRPQQSRTGVWRWQVRRRRREG